MFKKTFTHTIIQKKTNYSIIQT